MYKDDKPKLKEVIKYLEDTEPDSWCVKVVRSKDDKTNCLFGHLFAMYEDNKKANELWDWFEQYVATTYMVYPVNDGENKAYQQETIKARCIAYLTAILEGREKTTAEVMDEDYEEWKRRTANLKQGVK